MAGIWRHGDPYGAVLADLVNLGKLSKTTLLASYGGRGTQI